MGRKSVFLFGIASVLIWVGAASAVTWTDAYKWSSLWISPLNWDPPVVPGPFDDAYINPPPEQGPIIDCDVTIANILGPRYDSDSNQTIYINYGTVLVTGSWVFGDNGQGTSLIHIFGSPHITVDNEIRHRQGRAEIYITDQASLTCNYWLRVADIGSAVLDISGEPNIAIAGDLRGANNSGAWFEASVSGGTVSVGQSLLVGDYGSGVINVSGGLVNCGELRLMTRFATSTAQAYMSGGRVFVEGASVVCGGSGTASMNISGADVNTGQLWLAAGDGRGDLILTGGRLSVRGALAAPKDPAGTSTIWLENGTINCGEFVHAAPYTMDVNEGVLIIDGNVTQAVLTDVNAGYISPSTGKTAIMVDYNNINPARTTLWAVPHLEVVPNFAGLSEDQARTLISQTGLVFASAATEYNDLVPAGIVIGQDPNAGTIVSMGSPMTLVVSLGQPLVPAVVGMTLAQATEAIQAVDNLAVGDITSQYSDTVPAGVVLAQNPPAGTVVPTGSAVELLTSLGRPVVPNVIGLPEANAISVVQSVDNLSATAGYVYNNTVPAGFVVSQNPPGGTAVPIGSTVELFVSLGRPVVPDIIGMTEPNAASAIESVALRVGTRSYQYSDTVPVGIVLGQNPQPGVTVLTSSAVDLVVSLGRPIVPNVVGMTTTSATAAIEAVDSLTTNVTYQYSNTIPTGIVISQSPPGGTAVNIGTVVSITASLGRPVVPEVVGLSEAGARAAIEAVDNLTTAVTYQYHNTVPAGAVISQNPIGGNSVNIGTVVSIVVSLGCPVVPNVIGMTEAGAASAIESVTLTVGTRSYQYSDTVPAGFVISQQPQPGVAAMIGSAVDLVVSLGRPIVPDVVGSTTASAMAAIGAVDNLTADVTYQYSNTIPTGIVISQSPPADTAVNIGTVVSIAVSLGQPVVPEVVGLSETAAAAAIEAVDTLTVAATYQYHNTVPAGIVISQNPGAGTPVNTGTAVNIIVSLGRPTTPNVTGQTEAAAVAAIEAVDNLTAAVIYEYHNTVPAGSVISQNPVGGTAVDIGTAITITVSLGRPIVPNVIGQPEASAVAIIEAVDSLGTLVARVYHDTVPAGIVISQSPPAGTAVDTGTIISIVASLGRPVVPGVVGLTEAAAAAAVEAVDSLTTAVDYEYHDTVLAGRVIFQYPVAGTPVVIGTQVLLTVSLGLPIVPNVVGQTKAAAVEAIEAGGLAATTAYQHNLIVPADIVISQQPVAGTQLPIGSTVNVVVSLGPPTFAVLGANRLVSLQNNDGGWDNPLNDGNPDSQSDAYIFGCPAVGLARTYRKSHQSNEPNMLAALQKAGAFLLRKVYNFSINDAALAIELDRIYGTGDYTAYVKTNFYDKLAAGTYADVRSGLFNVTTAKYVQMLRNRNIGASANLGAWELGVGLYNACLIGAGTAEWIAGLKAEIDELNASLPYDIQGLAGAVLGLAAAGEDYDPQAGAYAAAANLNDLAEILAGGQLTTGGFTWLGFLKRPNIDEAVRVTAYAVLALSEFDRRSYYDQIAQARTYLQNVQLATAGWENQQGSGERNEITGEALWALTVAAPVLGDFDKDGTTSLPDFAIFASAWLSAAQDAAWNPDCNIYEPHDNIIDGRDLTVFIDNWLENIR